MLAVRPLPQMVALGEGPHSVRADHDDDAIRIAPNISPSTHASGDFATTVCASLVSKGALSSNYAGAGPPSTASVLRQLTRGKLGAF